MTVADGTSQTACWRSFREAIVAGKFGGTWGCEETIPAGVLFSLRDAESYAREHDGPQDAIQHDNWLELTAKAIFSPASGCRAVQSFVKSANHSIFLRRTSAEFLLPKAMQLQTAHSNCLRRPMSGM